MFEIHKIPMFETVPIFSYIFKGISGYSIPEIRVPTSPENPEIMNIEVCGLSNNKIEKLLDQNGP